MDQGHSVYGLPTNAVVYLALMQCTIQGALIPMVMTFVTTKSDHQPWFKIYVVFVNILGLGQTIVHIIQAFDIMSAVEERVALVAIAPILTGLIGASVQAFFAYRCWRIYHQRVLAMMPLLLLWLVSLISALALGAFLAQSASGSATPGTDISTVTWVISSLLFDLITTSSTVAYLYRARKELDANRSTLIVVWNVIWASAAPPLMLVLIALIDGSMRMSVKSPGVVCTISAAMSAKTFVLSLMITLVGQGYIRRQFERPYPSPPGNLESSQSQTDRANGLVTTGLTAHATDIELQRTSYGVAGASDYGSGTYHLDNASVECPSIDKRGEGDPGQTIHNIRFTPQLAS